MPSSLNRNYIEPERKNMLRSSTQKKLLKASPPKFAARSNKYNQLKMTKAMMEKQKKEQRILDECTFTPNIDIDWEKTIIRDADQFYRDQQYLEISKIERLNKLEQEIYNKENASHKPYLSKASETLAMRRELRSKNIHERLYSDHNIKKIREG